MNDSFTTAANTEPLALPTRFVSTGSINVGEGIRFRAVRPHKSPGPAG
jgi:hypothetical protein